MNEKTMLLQPIQIGSMQLKNRMVLAPMGVTIGNMTAATVDYFVERAKGGAAMIFCNIKGSATFESADHSIFFNEETESKTPAFFSFAFSKRRFAKRYVSSLAITV